MHRLLDLPWFLVNFLLLLKAYFAAAALWQGRSLYLRLSAAPFEHPPSPRSLTLYLLDIFMANLAGWILYPRYTDTVKPEVDLFGRLLFDFGHEHLGWYALALALALVGAGLGAGPELWKVPEHRWMGAAVVRIVAFLLVFIVASGTITFFTRRLVGA